MTEIFIGGGKVKIEGFDFIPAKVWRELGADDTLKSIEVAVSVLKDYLKGEALDEASELGRIFQLIDLSAVFQELAVKQLSGAIERRKIGA